MASGWRWHFLDPFAACMLLFSRPVVSNSLQPRGLQLTRPLSLTVSWSLSSSCPLHRCMYDHVTNPSLLRNKSKNNVSNFYLTCLNEISNPRLLFFSFHFYLELLQTVTGSWAPKMVEALPAWNRAANIPGGAIWTVTQEKNKLLSCFSHWIWGCVRAV